MRVALARRQIKLRAACLPYVLFLIALVEPRCNLVRYVHALLGIERNGLVQNQRVVLRLVVFREEVVEAVLQGLAKLRLHRVFLFLRLFAVFGVGLLLALDFRHLCFVLRFAGDASVLHALLQADLHLLQGLFPLSDDVLISFDFRFQLGFRVDVILVFVLQGIYVNVGDFCRCAGGRGVCRLKVVLFVASAGRCEGGEGEDE